MREIKFRGKRADNGEWVYGSLMIGFTGITYIIVMHDHILSMTEMYEVNSETVGQFTGLTDKNGKDIYEGDIVEFLYCPNIYKEKITGYICLNQWFNWIIVDREIKYHIADVTNSEVISNIHENK